MARSGPLTSLSRQIPKLILRLGDWSQTSGLLLVQVVRDEASDPHIGAGAAAHAAGG
jgi:hypothetical protein